jgi:hypothetical protein
MSNSFDYNFDRSAYERPNNLFVCGRATEWGKPCGRGPNGDGTCGGTAECKPFDRNGRWECRRSPQDGGPCTDGPGPDGICGCSSPPCVPRRSMRQQRWRLSVILVGVAIALIAVFTQLATNDDIFAGSARLAALDAGDLTGSHSGFTGAKGCKTCHESHDAKPLQWLTAAFSKDDLTERCVDCHKFGGPANKPHNAVFTAAAGEKSNGHRKTECTMCHTEHKGENADISGLNNQQCASCHKKAFSSFDLGHPKFSKQFPHFRRAAIRFNHVSHLNKNFLKPEVKDKAPASCTSCHQATSAQRSVEPLGFDKSCAGCHADQISKRNLVVLRLPEFEESQIDKDAVIEACGPAAEDEEEDEEYESVSAEELNSVGAFLMNVTSDDPEAYSEAFQTLLMAMAEEGTVPLAGLLEDADISGNPSKMFAGLNPEAVKRMACAWAKNQEYELPADPQFGGWYGDIVDLIYRPAGHGDPVVKAWLEMAISAKSDDDDVSERISDMRDELLSSREGAGACVKCHAVSQETEEGPLKIEWTYQKDTGQSYQTYSHSQHLSLVNPQGVKLADPTRGCATCHKLDQKADFASGFKDFNPKTFSSNFASLNKQACVQCHTEGRVRQDCQLCHDYHKEPGFTDRVTRNEN